MTIFNNAIFNISEQNLIATKQTVESAAITLNLVFKQDDIWYVAKGPIPQGLYIGSNNVALSGVIILPTNSASLVTGKTYFATDTGTLTTNITNIKVGFALAADTLFLDISSFLPVNNPYAAYICGGLGAVNWTAINDIERFIFNTRTSEAVSISLSNKAWHHSTFQNQINGYLAGGGAHDVSPNYPKDSNGAPANFNAYSSIDKITFARDKSNIVLSTLTTTLPEIVSGAASYSSSIAGYSTSGYCRSSDYLSSIIRTKINKFIFSDESIHTLSTQLTSEFKDFAREYIQSNIQNQYYGYAVGGRNSYNITTDLITNIRNWIDHNTTLKLSFELDSIFVLSSLLHTKRSNMGTFCSNSDAFLCGGVNYSAITQSLIIVEKLNFDTDIITQLIKGLDSPSHHQIGCADKLSGYLMGNQSKPDGTFDATVGATTASIYVLPFSTESLVQTTKQLTKPRSAAFPVVG
jgi:hypothetical protein